MVIRVVSINWYSYLIQNYHLQFVALLVFFFYTFFKILDALFISVIISGSAYIFKFLPNSPDIAIKTFSLILLIYIYMAYGYITLDLDLQVGKLDVWAPRKPADIDRWRRMSARTTHLAKKCCIDLMNKVAIADEIWCMYWNVIRKIARETNVHLNYRTASR